MQLVAGRLVYSASDLNGFLECRALTEFERDAAEGRRTRPKVDEATDLIARKGDAHEQRFLARLREAGPVYEIPRDDGRGDEALARGEAATLAAMERGERIIYQATFFDGTFLGHADFLRRVETRSERWPWSYEVLDTKLALRTKTYFLVQLCNYSEHVARLQGTMPKRLIVIPGNNVEATYDVAEYFAYYSRLKEQFLAAIRDGATDAYPHEVTHCHVCLWNALCEQRREDDDYLGIVAWMRRDQVGRLQRAGIATLAALARAGSEMRPSGMAIETYDRLRDQARLQYGQRTTGVLAYETLPLEPQRGFALLPQPEEGDVFFDMEGDPLYTPERGLEYLFGAYLAKEERYFGYWAHSALDEGKAFEDFVDFLVQRRAQYPLMHVYHYAPYETTALKRLAGFYATREEELDELLRGQVFVDLYAVVRQGMRISQPSYSIKKLEPFYGFTRETKTRRGDDSILMFESWLADGDDNILVDIENYNRDDCISTWRLRDWLLACREKLLTSGAQLAWRAAPEPPVKEPEASDSERAALREELLAGLEPPATAAALRERDETFRARWLLGHLLDYHRRDEKPAWWAYFYRCDNRDELVEFDREAIGGLTLREDVAPYKNGGRNLVYVYAFPEQAHALSDGDSPHLVDAEQPKRAGTIEKIDADALLLHLRLAAGLDPASVVALSPLKIVASTVLRDSLARVAHAYRDKRLVGEHRAIEDLLLARPPRADLAAPSLGAAALSLDESYLFVQGPPGSGKSTKGAAMVVDLLAAGKRVAILANAHKAIHNLLHKVEDEAQARGVRFAGIQRYASPEQQFVSTLDRSSIVTSKDNASLAEPHNLAAGTAWVFARPELEGAYDYLVIDEAGQVSLANALAAAPCARNVVLLGDPLQLAQVSQGAHPPGVALSVLEHLLGDVPTVPPDRGIFLDRSFRMHPEICAFISKSVYGGRLESSEKTAANRVASAGLNGSGLRFIPVEHSGNRRESAEEADRIVREIALLCEGRVAVDGGPERPFTQRDALVVAPYNAQRLLITERLADAGFENVRVGTVDKFQGQEAPVVFYSMATSSGEDVPRDVGFLFERNRLNVAISRAQCMSVLVCSPRLLDTRCSTPEQMALVNLLCRFVESAEVDFVQA